jgi:tripartite-type tricarboxylate transporter receptor subunit TctC
MKKIKYSLALLAAALCALAMGESAAQGFPSKPIRLVVPFPPGGPTDAFARLLANRLQDTWKQPVIVESKPGAGTVVGTDFVAKAAPDGHTLGMVTMAHVINPSLRMSLPYDSLKDIVNVTQLSLLHLLVAAHPSLEANTPAELIALAKRRPGKITYGTAGAGTSSHLGAELLNSMAGVQFVHVPYKGSAPAQNDLLGGRIDFIVDPIQPALTQYAKAGKIKNIGLMGAARTPLAPEIPVFAEVVAGFDAVGMFGLITTGGTPRETVQRIYAEVAAAIRTPELNERMLQFGMDPVASTPEAFDAFVRKEMAKWAPVVKATGATAD